MSTSKLNSTRHLTSPSPTDSSPFYQRKIIDSDNRSISSQKTTGGESFTSAKTHFSDNASPATEPHNQAGILNSLFGSLSLGPKGSFSHHEAEELAEEELKKTQKVKQITTDSQGGPRLRCRIGPSLDTLGIFSVNEDDDPQFIDSSLFMGRVVVRVKDFRGVTLQGTPPVGNIRYFDGKKRCFSIQAQGRFKQEFTADDILFGVEFKRKVIQPYGSWIAMKLASLIDPGITSDFNAAKPWCFSPLLSSMNLLSVSEAPVSLPEFANGTHQGDAEMSIKSSHVSAAASSLPRAHPQSQYTTLFVNEMLGDWRYTGETFLCENNRLILDRPPGTKVDFKNDKPEERRKYFQRQKNRQEIVFKKDFVYDFEIYAPFIDLNTFDVSLGIKVNLVHYLCNQPLVFKAKSKSLNRDIFTIEMNI